MKNSIHKFQVCVTIGSQKYVTAKSAANAWAGTVESRMYWRHSKKIGQAPHYDPSWELRNGHNPNDPLETSTLNGIVVAMYPGETLLKQKAYRRCIKIFQAVLK